MIPVLVILWVMIAYLNIFILKDWEAHITGVNFGQYLGEIENSLVYYKKGEVTWGTPLIITNIIEKRP